MTVSAEEVLDMKIRYPDLSVAGLSRECKISKSEIEQILKDHPIDPTSTIKCNHCGRRISYGPCIRCRDERNEYISSITRRLKNATATV